MERSMKAKPRNEINPFGFAEGESSSRYFDANDLVKPQVAAIILKKHLVTLAVWRREARGPAYIRGADVRAVLYRVGDLWDWAQRNTVDPSKFIPFKEAADEA
jgi:hypothetical protein